MTESTIAKKLSGISPGRCFSHYSQEDTMPRSTPSTRRAFLTSSAAVAATSVPLAAAAASEAVGSADAALLALGQQFDAALVPWSAGFEASETPTHADVPHKIAAYLKIRGLISNEMSGKDEQEIYDVINDSIISLAEAILELPAKTLAGLGVKARAAMWWLDCGLEDDAGHALVALVNDICAIAGVPLVDACAEAAS